MVEEEDNSSDDDCDSKMHIDAPHDNTAGPTATVWLHVMNENRAGVSGEPMLDALLLVCHENFLTGGDAEFFDYSTCDKDGSLCDHEEHNDAEASYFDNASDDDL